MKNIGPVKTAISAIAFSAMALGITCVTHANVLRYDGKSKDGMIVIASKDNPHKGGQYDEFDLGYDVSVMKSNNVGVIVDGYCASACTVVVDFAKRFGVNVCVTPYAVFGYHFARDVDTGEYSIPNYSQEVLDMVSDWREHGEPVYEVKYKTLKKIYKTC